MGGDDGERHGEPVDEARRQSYRWRYEAATAPTRVMPSVRMRSAVASALVVAVALAGSGALMFYLTQRGLIGAIREDQREQVADVARLVRHDDPATLGDTLGRIAAQGTLMQVLRGEAVVAASARWAETEAFTGLRPAAGQVLGERTGLFKLSDRRRPYVVLTTGARHDGTLYTVVVATSVEGQQESLLRVLQLLAIGFPLLILLIGGGTWVLVGRALRPVEQIRSRVAGIGAGRLGERVPVPQTRDEIASLATTMNEMLDRLQFAQQAQRQFVSDASHELRSPLATLSASLDVARAEPPAWPDLAGVMAAEVQRMSSLVDNLLLLARADDRGLPRRADDVDLDDVVQREVLRLRAALAGSGLAVRAVVHPVRVRGGELQLSQVVRNLVDNAARHATTTVGVRLQAVGATAVLVVEDDGPGIPEPDRRRVFERFVRLDSSRDRASGGSGLGLAIVAEVVAAHRGRVEVRAAPGGGAQLIVQLPAVPVDDAGPDDGCPDDDCPDEASVGGAQPPSLSSR